MDQSIEQGALFSAPEPEPAPAPAKPDPKATKKAQSMREAQELVNPWWAMYGDGWMQKYIVVVKVVSSALLNGVPVEDIKSALRVLGPEKTPVSGGTMAFALRKHRKSAEGIVAVQSARRDPRNFTHEL